ncbi:MAG: hypothetical protein KJO19_06825 [Woeseia sp.]|nr:hypothetical protein [Woeseia sp.]
MPGVLDYVKEPVLAVLASLFGHAPEQSKDGDKLMHLFWNRTELKKEFARLRKEQYRLRDKIKHQESKMAIEGKRLSNLESLLMNPDWARNALAYYQLRGLAQRCENKLGKFAEQLKQQREGKYRSRVLLAWNEDRARQRKLLERKLADVHHGTLEIEGRLRLEEAQRQSMRGLFGLFRRRGIDSKLEVLRHKLASAKQAEYELFANIQNIDNQKPPENLGLDVETKRSINFQIIAFAQQLYLQFGSADFAKLVKETMDHSVEGGDYGTAEECNALIERTQQQAEAMDKKSDFAELLQQRADLMAESAEFRSDYEVVPKAPSVSTVYVFREEGAIADSKVNLLGENYWGVANALTR